eukprot:Hpha_TRINITY_DN1316_c0_g1::TRINITY_DN1316_c0_g1_i1::g.93362::m.93362
MGTCVSHCCREGVSRETRQQETDGNSAPPGMSSSHSSMVSEVTLGPVRLHRRALGAADNWATAAVAVERAMAQADTQRREAFSSRQTPRKLRTARNSRRGELVDTYNMAHQHARRAASLCVVCNSCGARLTRAVDCIPRTAAPLQPVIDDATHPEDLLVVPTGIHASDTPPRRRTSASRTRRDSNSPGGGTPATGGSVGYQAILPPSATERHAPPTPPRRLAQDSVLDYWLSVGKCWQCRRFVGVCVSECQPRAGADAGQLETRRQQIGSFAGVPPRPGAASWPLALRLSFIGLRYTRLVDMQSGRSVLRRTPLHCTGCSEVMSWTDTFLCTKRRWGFGDGPSQGACYVSAVSSTVIAKTQREERLAQGRFLMEDLHCICGKQIGYKFVRDLSRDQRNINQVGRYGLVASCFRLGIPTLDPP